MAKSSEPPAQNLLTRLSAGTAAHFYRTGDWADETIYARAVANARSDGDKIAIRDRFVALSFSELVGLADRLAIDLAMQGLKPGDRIAAWLSSRAELAIVLLAASRNRYVLCPSLHRNHTVDDIFTLLKRASVRALVGEIGYGADSDKADIFDRVKELKTVRKIYRLEPPVERSAADIATAMGLDAIEKTSDQPAASSADDIVYLAFTSGTTGEPKGVMHSNNTLLANARAIASDWNFDDASVIYTLSPLSHNLGFGALVLGLHVGAQTVLHDVQRGASLLDRLRETGATFVFGVPAHAMDLLGEIEAAGEANLPKMRGFRISGAAASTSVVEGLLSYGIVPQSGYGMTEACSHHYTLPDDTPKRIINTSGRACSNYEVQIFAPDDPDRQLPTGEIGHIGGRGASLMLGYFDDQTNTENAFNRAGWFMTGDLGRLDEDGYLQITGRLKDIIIRGGHNIHPSRIEQLTMRYPEVERAAALPVKDERMGEKVCLVVMAKNGADVDPHQLLAHLDRLGLSKYDMPEYFLQVDEIPLSASGKMLKRALQPALANGTLSPQPIRFEG
ncbi:class I adenylate-forming enzyme family protein [Pseudohoeflea coraliihabitans]|uniref:Acyl--CoA ligase n=1 Tax=Pseudohoeflea coraliihabitans TaxID=2860393 RepID=A0ABS6WMS0_9HYPH|nr:class I adenylate-forming enzyme family protein [Pseudohoeflea sp. DP4N28-3]MBW3097247.1 acyl--CoA ligase [Pseudohoeflea sp. DP4N28-3]